MKKCCSLPLNSERPESVTPPRPISEDPELILRLIDLIFLAQDEGHTVPS